MNNPKKVFLHCSATPDYPKASRDYDLFGALDIDEWHRKRGWNEIGYHYVIRRTGLIEVGDRHWSEYGAHVKGQNTDSLGVCYIGTRWPLEEQINAILYTYRMINGLFGITWQDWHGHYEFDSKKTCPGFSAHLLRELLRLEHESMMAGIDRKADLVHVSRSK